MTNLACLIKYCVKLWLKKNWLLLVGIIVGIVVFVVAWRIESDPDKGSSRYMLSAMAQVIGTVFVITIAVMQLIRLRKPEDIINLLSKPHFIVTAVVSFFGITLPLVVLYFNFHYITTAFCLGLGACNLVIIGWFIVRILYPKALLIEQEELAEKPTRETVVQRLQDLTLVDLNRRAYESLSLGISSNVTDVMSELLRRAKVELAKGEKNEQLVCDTSRIIHAIAIDKSNRFPEVWEVALRALIEIDTIAHKEHMVKLNFETASYIASFPVRYARTSDEEWILIRDHFFKCFHEDLFSDLDAPTETKRIELERAKSHEEIDYLSAMSSLLLAASATRKKGLEEAFKKWCEVQDKIIEEFTEAMEEPKLRERYPHQKVFVLIFYVVSDGIQLFNKEQDSDYLDSLDEKLKEFAEVALKDFERPLKPIEALNYLLAISKDDIISHKYNIKTTGAIKISNWPQFQIQQFQKRIHRKLNEAN